MISVVGLIFFWVDAYSLCVFCLSALVVLFFAVLSIRTQVSGNFSERISGLRVILQAIHQTS